MGPPRRNIPLRSQSMSQADHHQGRFYPKNSTKNYRPNFDSDIDDDDDGGVVSDSKAKKHFIHHNNQVKYQVLKDILVPVSFNLLSILSIGTGENLNTVVTLSVFEVYFKILTFDKGQI